MAKMTAPALARNDTPVERILRPMQEFIHQSSSGGIVLIAATIVALLLANSPLSSSYFEVLHVDIGITVGPFELKESLLHWINDGLMAIFFFLVGLEIKREMLVGELSDWRAALLPIVAAIGGVAVPALIYVLFNTGGLGAHGWAIPMATDIAFALGILSLLGSRAPFGLKVFLTAVAIVDDLIAVLMIALFYSSGINMTALGIGFLFLGLLILANYAGVRTPILYIVFGVLIWLAFLESGIHATIAGVLVAWTIPARTRIDPASYLDGSRSLLDEFERSPLQPNRMLTVERQEAIVREIENLSEAVQAPLQKIEHQVSPWSAFLIMPIFALANAGVPISLGAFGAETLPIALGVMVGLIFGKPIGLLLACFLVVRAGLAVLPQGVRWSHMVGAGFLAGIGFTMSLFITSLAFEHVELQDAAKMGILGASIIAGAIGFVILMRLSASHAEASHESAVAAEAHE